MHIHLIDFEYFYKNDPEVVWQATAVCPVPTSAQARTYFWDHIGRDIALLSDMRIEWDQIDNIEITMVRSSFIK